MSSFGKKGSTKSTTSKVIRPLGPLESLQSSIHLLGFYYSCAVACLYATPSHLVANPEATSLENLFEQALAATILEHSLLQVGLQGENSKKPSWVKLDTIDLWKNVEWGTLANDDDSEDVLLDGLRAQHDTPFPHLDQQPLWRIVIFHPTSYESLEVVFAWNHAAADGMSGKIFHQSLLKNLNLVSSGQSTVKVDNHRIQLPKTMSLTPAVEDLLKFPVTPGFLALEGWRSLRPSFSSSSSPYTAKWAPNRLTPNKTQVGLIEIQSNVLQSLLKTCRQHETTATGLIHALTLLSFSARLDPTRARAFETGTPFELRRFIKSNPPGHPEIDPSHLIGNFVSYFAYKIDPSVVTELRSVLDKSQVDAKANGDVERIVWSVARDFKEKMNKRLEAGTKNDMLGLTKLVSDWRKYHQDKLNKPRSFSWEVSNLGVIDGSSKSKQSEDCGADAWALNRAIFSQSAPVTGAVYTINPVTVKGGSLMISCVWQHEVIEESLVAGVTSDLQTWLEDLGTGRALNIGRI